MVSKLALFLPLESSMQLRMQHRSMKLLNFEDLIRDLKVFVKNCLQCFTKKLSKKLLSQLSLIFRQTFAFHDHFSTSFSKLLEHNYRCRHVEVSFFEVFQWLKSPFDAEKSARKQLPLFSRV